MIFFIAINILLFCRWKSTSNATTDELRAEDAKNAITKYYLYLVNGVSQYKSIENSFNFYLRNAYDYICK